jgi:hypothetical protein
MVGGDLGKEDYVAITVDLSCVDLHFASDEGAKAAARVRVLQKAGASEEWLAFVAADLEAEGLTDPMTKKVAEAVEVRCPGGILPPQVLDAATTEPAPASGGDPAPADPKDDAAPADDPK